MIQGYAAIEPGKPLEPFEFDPGPLKADEVEIDVQYCGICHSDLSMIENEWQMSAYPFVPGHEVVGRISAIGDAVRNRPVGQMVGLGWFARSCLTCRTCLSGDHNLCEQRQDLIVGRHGGFANKVRCQSSWAIPLLEGLDEKTAGPLFCGGITVFNPMVQHDVHPTDHVGVVGIGGLGHLALQYARAWGCEVTAFTSNPDKAEAARRFGAHHVVSSRDERALKQVADSLDFLMVTVNVPLNWDAFLATLRPGGRMHFVGGVLEPVPTIPMQLIGGQKSISGTPLGSPAMMMQMLEFSRRHRIAPEIEMFPMSAVNAALDHLRGGKPRYRIVLEGGK